MVQMISLFIIVYMSIHVEGHLLVKLVCWIKSEIQTELYGPYGWQNNWWLFGIFLTHRDRNVFRCRGNKAMRWYAKYNAQKNHILCKSKDTGLHFTLVKVKDNITNKTLKESFKVNKYKK